MSFRQILCPIDFSPRSMYALRTAAQLAVRDDASLVLLHVVSFPAIAYGVETPLPGVALAAQFDVGEERLAEARDEAHHLGATDVATLIERGDAADTIIAALSAGTYDLCVVGTHGRTGFARVALGSVAEKVIRHAPCPVLAARAGQEMHHILCPVDFSPSSERAAELAARLVDLGGTVTLLHIREPDARSSDSARLLEQWGDRLRASGVTSVLLESRVGHPASQILNEIDADPSIGLVVMGSHGRAEKITRRARCSALVVHDSRRVA